MSENCVFSPSGQFLDIFRAFFDIFRAFCRHSHFLGCPTIGPLQKKKHKHKLFGPDFPRTFLTLTPGCPGVKKFVPTTGAAGNRTFWCGRPRFSARTSMTRRVVEKLCAKKVCVGFSAPTQVTSSETPSEGSAKRVSMSSLGGVNTVCT